MWSYAIFRYSDCSGAKHDDLVPLFRMMDHAYTLSCLGGELLIAKQTSKAGETEGDGTTRNLNTMETNETEMQTS